MLYSQTELWSRINRKIHNAKGKIGGDDELQDILNEALDNLRLDIDLISAQRNSPNFLIFNDIDIYPIPEDCDYDKTIFFQMQDIAYQGAIWDRVDPNYFYQVNNGINQPQAMWPQRSGWGNWGNGNRGASIEANPNKYTVDYRDGRAFLRMRNGFGNFSSAEIADTSAISPADSGTWVISGDGDNLAVDRERYKAHGASLRFDSLGATETIVLQNDDLTPVDLSNNLNAGTITFWLSVPAVVPESVTFRFGSSTTDYWTGTVTTDFTNLPFFNGWNLLGKNWELLTQVGSPDITQITYFRVDITNEDPIAQIGYNLDLIRCHLGKQVVLQYYSKYLVIGEDGVRKEKFTLASDMTILEGQEVNLLIERGAAKASQELREYKDMAYQDSMYEKDKAKNLERRPDKTDLESTTYYVS